MNQQISQLLKDITKQINLEAISTKDLVNTLSDLYSKVEKLEADNKNYYSWYESEKKEKETARTELARIQVPLNEIESGKKALAEARFKFDIEKNYMQREVTIYQEILRALTTSIGKYVTTSSSNGNYYNENLSFNGPNFPQPK